MEGLSSLRRGFAFAALKHLEEWDVSSLSGGSIHSLLFRNERPDF
jgi:hypothetical protein